MAANRVLAWFLSDAPKVDTHVSFGVLSFFLSLVLARFNFVNDHVLVKMF
jgi:hypothetical protein